MFLLSLLEIPMKKCVLMAVVAAVMLAADKNKDDVKRTKIYFRGSGGPSLRSRGAKP